MPCVNNIGGRSCIRSYFKIFYKELKNFLTKVKSSTAKPPKGKNALQSINELKKKITTHIYNEMNLVANSTEVTKTEKKDEKGKIIGHEYSFTIMCEAGKADPEQIKKTIKSFIKNNIPKGYTCEITSIDSKDKLTEKNNNVLPGQTGTNRSPPLNTKSSTPGNPQTATIPRSNQTSTGHSQRSKTQSSTPGNPLNTKNMKLSDMSREIKNAAAEVIKEGAKYAVRKEATKEVNEQKIHQIISNQLKGKRLTEEEYKKKYKKEYDKALEQVLKKPSYKELERNCKEEFSENFKKHPISYIPPEQQKNIDLSSCTPNQFNQIIEAVAKNSNQAYWCMLKTDTNNVWIQKGQKNNNINHGTRGGHPQRKLSFLEIMIERSINLEKLAEVFLNDGLSEDEKNKEMKIILFLLRLSVSCSRVGRAGEFNGKNAPPFGMFLSNEIIRKSVEHIPGVNKYLDLFSHGLLISRDVDIKLNEEQKKLDKKDQKIIQVIASFIGYIHNGEVTRLLHKDDDKKVPGYQARQIEILESLMKNNFFDIGYELEKAVLKASGLRYSDTLNKYDNRRSETENFSKQPFDNAVQTIKEHPEVKKILEEWAVPVA